MQMEGKRRIMLGSNNYLGLTTDPQVMEAGIHALERYGTGCSGSRFLNGTLKCTWSWRQSWGIPGPGSSDDLFPPDFRAIWGSSAPWWGCMTTSSVTGKTMPAFTMGAKLSYGKMLRYRHNDMTDLRRKLEQVPESCSCLIVTDGVFSMGETLPICRRS